MFAQLKKKNNKESGIVLFIVLMTAIIIMIFSLGILTQSMNEINYAQQQIDQIASEQWSKGVFWNAYSNSFLTPGMTNVGIPTTIQGRLYFTTVNNLGSNEFNITTNYDTFQ
jgi:ABC-type Fe3+ transport system permease subunit